MTTTAAAETTGTTGDDGLLCGQVEPLCGDAPWEVEACEEPCPPVSEPGECVLGALAKRSCGAVEILRCAPECQRVHYTIRCTSDEVIVQVTTLDGQGMPKEHLAPQACTLAAPLFFQGCLEAHAPPCSDPFLWVSGCGPFVAETCPL